MAAQGCQEQCFAFAAASGAAPDACLRACGGAGGGSNPFRETIAGLSLLISVALTLILKLGGLLPHSDTELVFLLLLLYSVSCLAFW